MGVFTGALGAIGGQGLQAATQIGTGAALGALQLGYNKKLQKRGYDFSRRFRQNQYQDMRQSLEAAGFNPILALGGSPGAPGNFGSTIGGLGSSAAGGALLYEQWKQAREATKRMRNEAKASEWLPRQAQAQWARTVTQNAETSAAAVRAQLENLIRSFDVPMGRAQMEFFRENPEARRAYLYRQSYGPAIGTAAAVREFLEGKTDFQGNWKKSKEMMKGFNLYRDAPRAVRRGYDWAQDYWDKYIAPKE